MLMLSRLMVKWHSLFEPREEGQGLVEYALILVLVSIAVILALTALSTQVSAVFNRIVNELTPAT